MMHLKIAPFLFALALASSSCRTTQPYSPTLTARDGLQWLSIDTMGLEFPLYGDYWVHDLDDDYFPNIREDFVEYWEKENGRRGTSILANAHTTLPPYAAMMVIVQPMATDDEATEWKHWQDWLTTTYEVTGWETQSFGAPFGECRQAGFSMPHPELRRQTQVVTYQWAKGDTVIRWLFWGVESDARFLFRESEGMLSRTRVRWYPD